MILPVYIYGQPVLRNEAELVTKDYEGLNELIENMKETMYASNGIDIEFISRINCHIFANIQQIRNVVIG